MIKGYQEISTGRQVNQKLPASGGGAGESFGPGRLSREPEPVPGVEAALHVLASPDRALTAGTVFYLDREAMLGRGSNNKVVVPDSFASVEHARIYKKQGQYWLEDLRSKNGTYLNDVKVKVPTVLADKDQIRIGGVILQFVRWSYEMESGQ